MYSKCSDTSCGAVGCFLLQANYLCLFFGWLKKAEEFRKSTINLFNKVFFLMDLFLQRQIKYVQKVAIEREEFTVFFLDWHKKS